MKTKESSDVLVVNIPVSPPELLQACPSAHKKDVRMFYGWKLSGFVSLGNLMLQGSLLYMMNAFLEPLTVLYGWSRADISLVMSVAAIGGALSTPVLSTLSLRVSLRALMTMGTFVGGLSIVVLGWTSNYPLFCLAYTPAVFLVGLSFGCLLMVSSSVMSQLKPRLVDVGLSSYVAMAFMCSAAFCAALAKYIWGWLCDSHNPVLVPESCCSATFSACHWCFCLRHS